MSSWSHKAEKRAASKTRRQAVKRMIPEKLADDYPLVEARATPPSDQPRILRKNQ